MPEVATTKSGHELVALGDAETFTLLSDPKFSGGLTIFQKRRQTGTVDVVATGTDTRWFFEMVSGPLTGSRLIFAIEVPEELGAFP